MKLIDFHTHIYPDNIAEKATHSVENFYDLKAKSIGTVNELLRLGKEAGVIKSIILPVAIKPSGVVHINDFAHHMQCEHGEFISFGTVHAGMENITDEVSRITDMGLHGIKIHPDTQLFNIDDERMFPVYEMIEGKIPLITHTGDPRYDYSHPERLRRVMKMFPRLICVAAHFGGWEMTDKGIEFLSDIENCYVDMSSTFYYMPLSEGKRLISAYGEDRVLFASDFPAGSPVKEKENLMKMDISDDAKEKIAYKNAERFLNTTF